MQLCPGFGPTKVRRLREAFNKPFYSTGQKPLGAPTAETTAAATNDSVNRQDSEAELVSHDVQVGYSASPFSARSPSPPRPNRHSSPEWDIAATQNQTHPDVNLDLNLELNPSDEETDINENTTLIHDGDAPASKKQRAGAWNHIVWIRFPRHRLTYFGPQQESFFCVHSTLLVAYHSLSSLY